MRRDRLAAVALALLVGAAALPGAVTAIAGGNAGSATTGDGVTIDYEGDALTLAAGPGQAVRGQADLPPGTTLSLHVRATGDNPFLKPAEAVVDQDGRFRGVVDLSDVPVGAEFTVSVGSHDVEVPGEVVECTGSCESGGDDATDPGNTHLVHDGDGPTSGAVPTVGALAANPPMPATRRATAAAVAPSRRQRSSVIDRLLAPGGKNPGEDFTRD